MNGDLVPAVVAAGGGSAMAAGIWWRERRIDEAMRASRVRLGLRFPIALDPLLAKAGLSGLSGLAPGKAELVFEVTASAEGIKHAVWLPEAVRASATATLTGALPGLRVTEAPAPTGRTTLALRLFVATPTVLAADNPVAVSRTLLSGLAALSDEQVVIRWALRPGSAPPLRTPEPMDRAAKEIERVWRQKSAAPGFQASGLVLVQAGTVARARELAEHVASSLRSQRGSVGGVRITSERGNRSLASVPKTTRSSGWVNTNELLGLLGWPLGDEPIPGVESGTARELLVPRHVPREGRRLFVGRDGSGERPVMLSPDAARLHMAVIAATGAGKSALLMRCILCDLPRYGGVLIDPKNDLATDLIDRIPAEHAERVVFLDPATSGPMPGLNLFGSGDPDMRADVILSALKGIYKDAWGVRISSYLHLGLRTVAGLPNPVLSDWIGLYTDPALRARAVGRLRDPILVGQWRSYEALSAAEQYQHVAPALSRISALLSRPALRNVLNQTDSRLDIARLLAERKWLIVSLSPGTLGEAAAHLLGALVGYLVWTAIEARVTLPVEQRHPVFLYFDELQSLTTLPVGLERFFERSRGLGCGVVVATQSLARLPESTRQSLLGNVGSLIAFRAGADEAARIARELPGLQASDIMGLARFEVAARISTGGLGSGTAVVTGRTEGPPQVTGQAAVIRRLTAERYGRDPREIEEELRRRIEGQNAGSETPLGRTRRQA